jgi:hypothetical protein
MPCEAPVMMATRCELLMYPILFSCGTDAVTRTLAQPMLGWNDRIPLW